MNLLTILLQDPIIGGESLIKSAENVSSGGGYTFAVSLLMFIMTLLLFVIKSLWGTIKEKEEKYTNLAQSTTTMLTEVNMKLDNQDEIKNKIEKIIDILQTKLVNP